MMQYSDLQTKVLDFPILKNHFDRDKGEIILNPKSQPLKPLGKVVFGLTTMGVIGGLGYLIWTYVLPPVMIMLGQFLALALTGLAAVFLIIMLPNILKIFRRFSEHTQKAIIRQDPFGELQDQKKKMLINRDKFKDSKIRIKSLRNDMEIESSKCENDSKMYQLQILKLNDKAKSLKDRMDSLIAQNGVAAKDTDEYVELENELTIKLSDAQRINHQMEQSKQLVQKYGSRANVMSKLDRNLTKAETAMNIKIADFDATVDILQKEFEYAQKSRTATDAAKSVLSLSEEWELTYALDVVKSTISLDLAKTSENIGDINTLTSNFSIDNDELFANLEKVASKIAGGNDVVPSAQKYKNPNYKLTQEDKVASGGFGNIF